MILDDGATNSRSDLYVLGAIRLIAGSPCLAGTIALVLAGVVCRWRVLRERRQGEQREAKYRYSDLL